MTARIVDVRQGVLSKNDALAVELRQRFDVAGVTVINLVSSPGAGKTALLERTLADSLERAGGPPPSSATWRPKTTPAGWRAAAHRCAKSSLQASAIWRPRWWPRTWLVGI